MHGFMPYAGLHVTLLTHRGADTWTRHCHGIPSHVGLGWKPYRILVQSHGATAYKAFHDVRSLRAWLGGRFTVRLAPYRAGGAGRPWAVRSGEIVTA